MITGLDWLGVSHRGVITTLSSILLLAGFHTTILFGRHQRWPLLRVVAGGLSKSHRRSNRPCPPPLALSSFSCLSSPSDFLCLPVELGLEFCSLFSIFLIPRKQSHHTQLKFPCRLAFCWFQHFSYLIQRVDRWISSDLSVTHWTDACGCGWRSR